MRVFNVKSIRLQESGLVDANKIIGSGGTDLLTGGAGADIFVFNTAPSFLSRGGSTITDFTSGTDHIALSKAMMAALGPLGPLGDDAFWSGDTVVKGHDTSDRLIYEISV